MKMPCYKIIIVLWFLSAMLAGYLFTLPLNWPKIAKWAGVAALVLWSIKSYFFKKQKTS